MKPTTLFKTVYGSHLYGTSTPSSDIDYKAVVLIPIEILLRGTSVKNSVESTSNESKRNTSDDVDYEEIPLQVLAHDFLAGQTYALELVFAITEGNANVSVQDENILTFCKELRGQFLTKNVTSMVGFAFSQAHKYGVKGKRLDAIHTLKYLIGVHMSLHGHGGVVGDLKDDVDRNTSKYLYNSEYDIGGYNPGKKPCVNLIDKIFPHSIKLTEAMERVEALIGQYGSRAKKAQEMDGHDWKAVSHAVRISGFAINLLENNKIDLPVSNEERELLLSIKNGEMDWDRVEVLINSRLEKIDKLLEKSTLPVKDEEMEKRLVTFLDKWLAKYYLNK